MGFLTKMRSWQPLMGLTVVLLLFLTIYTSETAPSVIFKRAGTTQTSTRNHNEPGTHRGSHTSLFVQWKST